MKLPIWKCHKEVEAFQIEHITAQPMGTHTDTVPEPRLIPVPRENGVEMMLAAQHTEYVLVDKTGEFVAVVSDEYMMRSHVHTGGYFVRYSNGFESFSPADSFVDGYSQQEMKRILHVKMGSDDWEPTIEDMQAVMEMFMSAQADPTGAVVVTNQYIHSSVEKVLRTETHEIVVMIAEPQEEE